jgi:hopanoid-associated phosphorylase
MILAVVGMKREARAVRSPGVRPVISGGRTQVLEQRLEAELQAGASGVLSIGLAGALDAALPVGALVIGAEVLQTRSRWDVDAAWARRLAERLPAARVAPVFGSDEMVLQSLDKARLRKLGGAAAVDMESHTAARLAAAHGLPFAVLRVVSDGAGVSLPSAVRSGLNADGSMNLFGVLGALAREPSQLPALVRVGEDVDRAFAALKAARAAAGPDWGFG